MQVSIVGFGNFGKMIAGHLIKNGFNILVTDIINKSTEAEEIGAKFVSLQQACSSKVIILSVPMEKLENTLNNIKNNLQEGTIVIDVCSLKMFSSEAMIRILPSNVEIIGTHPLFGPYSAPNSIEGMKIVLVNVRAKEEIFNKIRSFCELLGLKSIITTAEEHDKQMAVSQALTHFLVQALKQAGITRIELSTLTFDKLMDVAEVIERNTIELFNDIQTMNPFARQVRDGFLREANALSLQLNSLDL